MYVFFRFLLVFFYSDVVLFVDVPIKALVGLRYIEFWIKSRLMEFVD